jgi:predicted kinase
MVRGVGQVGITGSGQDTMVAEDFLDFKQVDARFD